MADNNHVTGFFFSDTFKKLLIMIKNPPQAFFSSATSSNPSIFYWRIIQTLFWFIGVALLLFMMFVPPLGVLLFWNILIPVAPALLVIATGVWRNVCPLATTALLPDRFGFSKKKKLSSSQRNRLNLIGVLALLLIIPLRHVLFNTSGQATAIILIVIILASIITGFIYERKSVWCSGLCPIHPVEKLYGFGVALSLPNIHCNECVKCAVPCPDSTPNMSAQALRTSRTSKISELLLVGAFPGYIWGWFHVADYTGFSGWKNLLTVYGYPVLGSLVTLSLYLILEKRFKKNNKKIIINLFAAAAVSCYYWFRLPQLFGFDLMHSNGKLIDLTHFLPAWSMVILNLSTTGFFLWWMVIKKKIRRSWSVRPAYAKKVLITSR